MTETSVAARNSHREPWPHTRAQKELKLELSANIDLIMIRAKLEAQTSKSRSRVHYGEVDRLISILGEPLNETEPATGLGAETRAANLGTRNNYMLCLPCFSFVGLLFVTLHSNASRSTPDESRAIRAWVGFLAFDSFARISSRDAECGPLLMPSS
jgi:hypothetical protein